MNRPARLLASLVCAASGVGLAILSAGAAFRPSEAHGLALSALYGSACLALFACAGALVLRRPVVQTLGLAWPPSTRGWLGLAGYVLGTIGASQLLDLGLRELDLRETSVLSEIDRSIAGVSGLPLVTVLCGLALAPGFAEELLFRGLLLRTLLGPLGRTGAVLTTAVAFGALHIDLAQGGAAAVLGLYLGTVALASGSTWPAIACHVANNFVGVLLSATGLGESVDGPAVWAAAAALAAIGIGTAVHDLRAARHAQAPP